jgi:hypothetical protein
MALSFDGIYSARDREVDFHPTGKAGTKITAWDRRAATLVDTIKEVNDLRSDLDKLKVDLTRRPF